MKTLKKLLPMGGLVLLFFFLFWPALFSSQSLVSPDGPPYYVTDYAAKVFRGFYASWNQSMLGIGQACSPFYPQKFLALLLPPMAYHQWGYVVSIAFAGFSTWFYLRGRGIRSIALWAGCAAMAFSGYHFTLVSAGHRGVFDMTGWILLVFGALDRAITKRQWPYYAVIGAGTAHALAAQPDITLMYLLSAGAYALYLVVGQLRNDSFKPLLGRLALGSLLFGGVFLLLSLNTFGNLRHNIIPDRASAQGKSAEEKWIFATNWSLPPSEILEFAVPGVYGLETGHPKQPYWGDVGRTHEWETHKQGLKNLKQHTVYLGLIQLLFAGYLLARSLKKDPEHALPVPRSWVWFWSGVWLFALLLALGRYAPFYKLIYSLPRFDSIRAPIKFVHLMEWATTLLFAGGLSTMIHDLQKGRVRTLRAFGITSLGLSGLLVLTRVFFIGRPEAAAELLNMQAVLPAMQAGVSAGFTHSLLLAVGLGAGCLAATRSTKFQSLFPGLIFSILLLDLAYVGKPYVHTRDVSAHYAENPITESLQTASPVPPRVSWRMPIPMNWHHPIAGNFLINFTPYLEPAPNKKPDARYQEFFKAMPQNIPGYLRLLDLSSTSRVLCDKNLAAVFDQIPQAKRLKSFTPSTSGGTLLTKASRAWGFLYAYEPALPRASIVYNWEQTAATEIPKRLFSKNWDPASAVLVDESVTPSFSPTTTPPSPAIIKEFRSNFIRVEGRASQAGLLLLAERWDPDWDIKLNGEWVESIRVNHLMRGIEVPAGDVLVEMHYKPFLLPFILNLATTALLWPLLLVYGLRNKTRSQ